MNIYHKYKFYNVVKCGYFCCNRGDFVVKHSNFNLVFSNYYYKL